MNSLSLEVTVSLRKHYIYHNYNYPQLSQVFSPQTSHKCLAAIQIYMFVTQTTPTHQRAFNRNGSQLATTHPDQEIASTVRHGGPTRQEDYFLSPFCASASQGYSKAEIRHGPAVCTFMCTHPPPPILPFLLAQNLSPKEIARNDLTR